MLPKPLFISGENMQNCIINKSRVFKGELIFNFKDQILLRRPNSVSKSRFQVGYGLISCNLIKINHVVLV